jgi:hypothetical protein
LDPLALIDNNGGGLGMCLGRALMAKNAKEDYRLAWTWLKALRVAFNTLGEWTRHV